VRDVFAGDRTPDHLADAGFAAAAHRVLRPGGMLLANCADRPPLHLARREVGHLAAAFGPDAVPDGRVGVLAEHAILKGRRYGNVVLVAVRPEPEGDDGAGAPPTAPDLDDAALARRLRSLPVPARLLVGDELARFAGA